jgi:hypothetical protein
MILGNMIKRDISDKVDLSHFWNLVENPKKIEKKNFRSNFKKHDEYTTPDSAWDKVIKYIPKEKYNIWMPFYCDGSCGKYINKKGYNVLHPKAKDFFTYVPNIEFSTFIDKPIGLEKWLSKYNKIKRINEVNILNNNIENRKKWMVLDNVPFSLSREIMERLVKMKMPFMLLMPPGRIDNKYTQKIFKNEKQKLKILNPGSIKFTKFEGGNYMGGCKKTTKIMRLTCYWYCWGIEEIYNLRDDLKMTYI